MRIDIGEGSGNQFVTLNMVHGDQEMLWNVDTYKRSIPADVNSVFNNINGYLESLSDTKQKKIFNIYHDIQTIMDEVSEGFHLHVKVQAKVKELFDQVSFEGLRKWIRFHGRVGAPGDLKVNYEGVDNELTRRLTYLRDDYHDLAVFSALMKLAVPIFGEYIRRMGKEVGTKFKEHYAFSLVSKSNIIELPAFLRLRDYVEAKAQNEERKKPGDYRKNSAVFGGLGTEELPDWLLSRAIVRRVAIHEEAVGDNIVANIFHAVDSQINSLDKTFNGRVNEKRLYGSATEEDNISVAENYKVKQEISDGDLSVLSIYTEEMYDMAGRVDPTFDREKIRLCSVALAERPMLKIVQHHLTLTQWTLAKAISPRGIPSLNKPALLKAMSVTQGLLWHWGFIELATLMSAEPSEEASVAAGAATTRLGKKHTERFFEIYPHYQPVSKSAHNLRNVNVACKAIDLIAADLVECDWVSHGPAELIKSLDLKPGDTPHVVSAEIRHLLGDLLLKVREVRTQTANVI